MGLSFFTSATTYLASAEGSASQMGASVFASQPLNASRFSINMMTMHSSKVSKDEEDA